MTASTEPTAATSLWRRWRGTMLIVAANTAVAGAIALVTAILALVVEDALPIGTARRFSGLRWIVLVLALIALVTALLWRASVKRHSGTLFYVRLLDDTMTDWQMNAVDLAARQHLALRPVTRWVDLDANTTGGFIDVVDACAVTVAELRAAVLANPEGAGCTIAPNMLWPMALAVGAETPPATDLNLLELPGPHAERTKRPLAFRPPARPAPPGHIRTALGIGDLTLLPGKVGGEGRLGILLAFAPNAQHMTPEQVFSPFGVGEYSRIRPAWVGADLANLLPDSITSQQLADLTQALSDHITHIKASAPNRELVIAAALPKSLAFGLGFCLAQAATRFFSNTHLLHYDSRTQTYLPMRVHPSQPATLASP